MLKTSVTALLAAVFVGGAVTAAAACEWKQKQVMAKATPPAVEDQTEATATPIDPVLLARMEKAEDQATVQK